MQTSTEKLPVLMTNITPLFPKASQILFERPELALILDVYGRYVAAGLLRDYSIEMSGDAAIFSCYERATDSPSFQIIKDPTKAQGAYALCGRNGRLLKRGGDLRSVLAFMERKLIKTIDGA